MAKGKYMQWLEPDRLAQVENWAAKGCTNKEVAANMGVHPSTLCDWLNRHREFSEALKRGRDMGAAQVENAFFRKAVGLCEEVTVTEVVERRERDGELVVVHSETRTTRKQLAPDTGALAFYLKNRLGYRDNPPAEGDAGVMAKLDAVLRSIEGTCE